MDNIERLLTQLNTGITEAIGLLEGERAARVVNALVGIRQALSDLVDLAERKPPPSLENARPGPIEVVMSPPPQVFTPLPAPARLQRVSSIDFKTDRMGRVESAKLHWEDVPPTTL